jgi:hypothetical protein
MWIGRSVLLLGVGLMVGGTQCSYGQDAPAATAPAAAGQQGTAAPATPATTAKPAAAPVAAPVKAGGFLGIGAKKAPPYTGPTEIVVLAPTPMLDEEGRQRLDPDGKPMFNAPMKQQRDKFGHPLFDDKGKPVFQTPKELGYDEHGKKIEPVKEKPPKLTPVSIAHGTFTVDGIVGKAALNYDIADLKYIYLYVPGIGIAVVSNDPFPGAKEQAKAFNDKTLTVTVGEHTLEVASETKLMKTDKPEPAYVLLDREFALPSRFPAVGYGTLRVAPYAWPGAKPNVAEAGTLPAPPVPVSLRPVQLLKPCPAGFMRVAAKTLPGQAVVEQPCVPIAKGTAAAAPAKPAAAAAPPQ